MKKRTLSIFASTVILGGILVGCGGGSGSGSNGVSAPVAVQASVVNGVSPRGILISYNNQNCENGIALSTTTDSLTLSTTNMFIAGSNFETACPSTVISYAFDVTVFSNLAQTNDNGLTLEDKIGTTSLKGVKNKKVNIFSTIAMESGLDMDTFQEIDLNATDVDADVTAAKNLIQNLLALGVPLSTIVPSNEASTLLSNIVALANGDTGTTLATALSTVVTNFNNVRTTYGVTTDIDTTTDLTAAVTAARTKPKLTVSTVGIKVGAQSYSGSGDNFDIVRNTQTEAIGENPNVIITLAATGFKGSGDNIITDGILASNATLKAIISKDNKSLTITLNGVTITANTDKTISATVAQGSTLNVDSTFDSIDSVSGTLDRAITSNDLSFNVDTLIDAITTNNAGVTALKEDLIEKINTLGDYELTVGISGLNDTVVTNLADEATVLGTGFKGFNGEVYVGTTAQINQEMIEDVIDEINPVQSYIHTQISAINSATTATSVNSIKTTTLAVIDSKIAKINTTLTNADITEQQTTTLTQAKTSLETAKTNVTNAANTRIEALAEEPEQPSEYETDNMTHITETGNGINIDTNNISGVQLYVTRFMTQNENIGTSAGKYIVFNGTSVSLMTEEELDSYDDSSSVILFVNKAYSDIIGADFVFVNGDSIGGITLGSGDLD